VDRTRPEPGGEVFSREYFPDSTPPASGSLLLQVSVIGYYVIPQPPSVPAYLQTAGTDTTAPILSGDQDSSGDAPFGEIFLFDSAGNPIGGSPTAIG